MVRFFKDRRDKIYPLVKIRFAWTPKKIFGSYAKGYGCMGTVWLELYKEETYKDGHKSLSLYGS